MKKFIHCDALYIILSKPAINFLAGYNTIQATYNVYVFYFNYEIRTHHLMKQILIQNDMSFFIFPNYKHQNVLSSIQNTYLIASKWLFTLNLSMGNVGFTACNYLSLQLKLTIVSYKQSLNPVKLTFEWDLDTMIQTWSFGHFDLQINWQFIIIQK